MNRESVQLTKEQETSLATLYGRALDSRAPDPILGDPTAAAAVDRIDYDFSKLNMTRADAVSVAVRALYLDRAAAEALAAYPEPAVLHLGCGLDTRVLRVDPPRDIRWYDVDYPEVVDLRRRVYPELAERPGYVQIGSSVTAPGVLQDIPGDRPVVVVAEGLVQYIPRSDLVALLGRITSHFPTGRLAFDAWNSLAARLGRFQRQLRATGASLAGRGIDDPAELAREVPRLTVDSAIVFTDVAELDRLPRSYRVGIRLMTHIPAVRDMGRILRYSFGS